MTAAPSSALTGSTISCGEMAHTNSSGGGSGSVCRGNCHSRGYYHSRGEVAIPRGEQQRGTVSRIQGTKFKIVDLQELTLSDCIRLILVVFINTMIVGY